MKSLIEKYLSPTTIIQAQNLLTRSKKSKLSQVLSKLPDEVKYLSLEDLERLNGQYEAPKMYGYSKETMHRRGKARSATVQSVSSGSANINRTLEIGAKDGLVSYHLSAEYGKQTTCFDLNPKPLDDLDYPNTQFVQGDVGNMPFDDNSFDLVFSFNSFEHFHEPREALLEMIRVTRSGGLIYLDFGPLYFAPKGLHLYNLVLVPYCQLLFEKQTIEKFYEKNDWGTPLFSAGHGLNAWPINSYRELWQEMSDRTEIVKLNEHPTYKSLDVAFKHPECIKGKINSIDDLIITRIEILLKIK